MERDGRTDGRAGSLVVSPAQLGEVGQLLDADDGVVQRRLQALRHGVGQDHGDHHGQDVGDLPGQLEHDDRRRDRVRDRAGERRCTWGRWEVVTMVTPPLPTVPHRCRRRAL